MTLFHSTPGRSSRRKQHHRRTNLTPEDHDTITYDDDYSADDRFFSALERSKVRKVSCSASNSNSTPLSLPRQPVNSQTAYNPYMNIAQFPIFSGGPDDCPCAHLSLFSKVCRANNVSSVDMMTKIFSVTLEEEAALWYDLNIEPYELSWEEIKSSFSHAHGKIQLADQLRSQLMTINQGEEESVRSYFLRLQWILKKWPQHGLSDDLLKGVFVDGLRSDFQEWMAPQKPNSLNEALRLASCFEQVKSIRDVRRNVAVKCGFCGGSHEERGCEVREKMRELRLKNKEDDELGKRVLVGLERNLSGKISEGMKELGRSVSMATSISSSCVEGRDIQVGEGELGLKKKSRAASATVGSISVGRKIISEE